METGITKRDDHYLSRILGQERSFALRMSNMLTSLTSFITARGSSFETTLTTIDQSQQESATRLQDCLKTILISQFEEMRGLLEENQTQHQRRIVSSATIFRASHQEDVKRVVKLFNTGNNNVNELGARVSGFGTQVIGAEGTCTSHFRTLSHIIWEHPGLHLARSIIQQAK